MRIIWYMGRMLVAIRHWQIIVAQRNLRLITWRSIAVTFRGFLIYLHRFLTILGRVLIVLSASIQRYSVGFSITFYCNIVKRDTVDEKRKERTNCKKIFEANNKYIINIYFYLDRNYHLSLI